MRTGFADLRQSMFRMNLTLWVAMVGLIAAVLARGG